MTFLKRPHKYGARRTLCSRSHPHPSALEASVCEILLLREKAGEIRAFKYQHTVALAYGVRWKIDFSFERSPDWVLTFAEAKGAEDRDYKLKIRMWKNGCAQGPLEIWKGTHQRPVLVETVEDKR